MTPPRCGKCNGRILEDGDGTRYCIACGWNDSNITEVDRQVETGVLRRVNGSGDYQHGEGIGHIFPYGSGLVRPPDDIATPRVTPGRLALQNNKSEVHSAAHRRRISERTTGRLRRMRKEWFM